jgi:shikimate kinase
MRWFFLVGFMGAGKTTLGSKAAERLELPFYDLDALIELDAGRSIRKIFEDQGERDFRNRETNVLRTLIAAEPPGIIATGGGTFTHEENRTIMSQAGVTVWLDVPIDAIVVRVASMDVAERPLWKSDAELRALAERREKDYRLANHHLELGTDSTDDGAVRLYELLAPHCND